MCFTSLLSPLSSSPVMMEYFVSISSFYQKLICQTSCEIILEQAADFPLKNSKERSYLYHLSILENNVLHFSPFSPLFFSGNGVFDFDLYLLIQINTFYLK